MRFTTNIHQVLLGEEHPVKLALDLEDSQNGELSEEIRALGLSTLQNLVKKARELGCQEDTPMPGVATAVFRKAKNGEAFLSTLQRETGVRLQVVSQQEEARLGFQTAVAEVECTTSEVPHEMVVWDSGGGSFQIVRDRTDASGGGASADTYLGGFAVAVATRRLVEEIQGRDFAGQPTPNPVSLAHTDALIEKLRASMPRPTPKWPHSAPKVYAIGNTNSIFFLARDVLNKTQFTSSMVKGAIEQLVGQDDTTLAAKWCTHPRSDPPSLLLPKLCLLYAVMTELGVIQVEFVQAIGSW